MCHNTVAITIADVLPLPFAALIAVRELRRPMLFRALNCQMYGFSAKNNSGKYSNNNCFSFMDNGLSPTSFFLIFNARFFRPRALPLPGTRPLVDVTGLMLDKCVRNVKSVSDWDRGAR